MSNRKTKKAVSRAVERAVDDAVYWAVDWAVDWAVGEALYWPLRGATDRFVFGAAEEDPPHPALRDYLGVVQ